MLPLLLLTAYWTADPAAAEIRIPAVVVTLIDQVEIPARDPGVLMQRLVTEGQVVEEGQLLGTMDDRDAKLLRARAEAELAIAQRAAQNELKVRFAQKAADVARAELKRAADSVEKFSKSISQTELDRLQLLADKAALEMEQAHEELATARLHVEVKRHELQRAQLQDERRRIISPLTGVVVQWKRNPGEWVEPGAPVVRVIRLHKLRAEGFAPADQLAALQIGRKVTLSVDSGPPQERTFHGELIFVSPEIDPVNRQVRFWAEIDNSQLKLRPGQNGSLVIHASIK
ncbi:MAG TPA: HlyD family efflux transporter periplasmic adaptor subunit [Planctomycetaceae bacterium]|nr:HlyD family efflux transporter periplasmic adaptor subunit [Planctomycetaceae bacterium]